jgi:hypothetical protein
LVANSPGLIAGSNVLHRLLVPRHPPIALSSLSHNKKLQRCSRPLCSSQNTGRTTDPIDHHLPASNPHHQAKPPSSRGPPTSSMVRAGPSHTTTPTPNIPHNKGGTRAAGAARDPEKPNHPVTRTRPDSSGPNSAPRPSTQHHPRSTPKPHQTVGIGQY